MRLVEYARARPWLAVACAGAVVGAVIGLFLPIRAAAPTKADEAAWTLPTRAMTTRFDDAKYQSVRSARFWGEIKAPGERGAQNAGWTLSGIVTRPVVSIAVTVAGKPGVTWVRLGDALPDGAVFVAANRDTVWYEKDGCRRARTLYQKPAAESAACIGADSSAPRPGAPATRSPASVPAAPPARNSP